MGSEIFVVACSACDAEGADNVTPIGCSACGARYEEQYESSDASSDSDGDDVFEIGTCHTCGIRGDEYIEGKFCRVCGGRADGCDFCKDCDNEGCDECLPTSPMERLKVYREGMKVGAPVFCTDENTDSCAVVSCKLCSKDKSGGGGHVCYGKHCPVCELRAKYHKKPIGTQAPSSPLPALKSIGGSISLVENGENAVMMSDPLSTIPPPVFVLNPWGMFIFNPSGAFPYSLIQVDAEGDWQFPPSAKAVSVLGMLQRSRLGTEFSMLVMNRLCLFLLFAPRMTPKLAPRAVETTHRIMEAVLPETLNPIAAPYTQDEVDWVVAGVGVSFRELEEARLWTFVYEMIVGLITADEKAALMYRTIMSYSPLMSLVEAKKYRESVEQRDPYALISVHFPASS